MPDRCCQLLTCRQPALAKDYQAGDLLSFHTTLKSKLQPTLIPATVLVNITAQMQVSEFDWLHTLAVS